MAKKYKYTMLVKKVLHSETKTVIVIAENLKEAERLAIEEAEKHPEMFDGEGIEYTADVFSHTCNPVCDD